MAKTDNSEKSGSAKTSGSDSGKTSRPSSSTPSSSDKSTVSRVTTPSSASSSPKISSNRPSSTASLSSTSGSDKTSSRQPVAAAPSNSKTSADRPARSSAPANKTSSSPRQSSMGEGGFDALMAQLDAGTVPRSEAAANLLNTPGALDQIVQAGSPIGSVGGLDEWLLENGGNFLAGENDYREGRIAERQAAGVEPSEGPIDWNAVLYDLNGPVRERGVEFEGPVDWGGIGNAIGGAFGGISDALSAPAPRLARELQNIPTNNGGLVERDRRGTVDPQTGFVLDPQTGTYYRPDYAPVPDRLPTEIVAPVTAETPVQAPFTPSVNFSGFDAIGGLGQGFAAEQRRLAGIDSNGLPANPDLPRARPAHGTTVPVQEDPYYMPPSAVNPAPAEPLEGMVPGARPITAAAAEEPTVWDRAVDMAGGAMGNTLLGGAVKSLFPDFWYGAGETVKGNGGGGTLGPSSTESLSPLTDGSQSNGGGSGLTGFIDMNGNGIDDRLEGYMFPPVGQPSVPPRINYGNAVFPDMPPYNPGVSDEWQYFRPQGYAHGGLVHYAEGGEVAAVASQSPNGTPPIGGLDPRITIIADAEDALEGESPNPEEAIALFVQMFGQDALEILKTNVQSGMTLRGYQRKKPRMAKGRFIEGAGGPTDDAIPAVIDGEQPAALSDGEFVLPAAAVRGAGDGDKNKGAAKLEQLSAMLAGSEQ